MKQRIRRIAGLLTAILLMAGVPVPSAVRTQAAETDIPSLFCNNEAWYKDGVAPLVMRDGIAYVPAELFELFDSVSVSSPNDNNLLIHNLLDGRYISILFTERRAAVNGTIYENINTFRDEIGRAHV